MSKYIRLSLWAAGNRCLVLVLGKAVQPCEGMENVPSSDLDKGAGVQ